MLTYLYIGIATLIYFIAGPSSFDNYQTVIIMLLFAIAVKENKESKDYSYTLDEINEKISEIADKEDWDTN